MLPPIPFDVQKHEEEARRVTYSLYFDLLQQGYDEEMFIEALVRMHEEHQVTVKRSGEYIDDEFEIEVDDLKCRVKMDPAVAATYISCESEDADRLQKILGALTEVGGYMDEKHLRMRSDLLSSLKPRGISPETRAMFEGLGIPFNHRNAN